MYFDDAALPPKLEWVETDFPFPLALTFARMRVAFDRQQPLEAVWAVRDAWEVAIKFCACVSVADFLHADPDQAVAERVAVGLLSDRGVAIGGWKDTLVLTLPEPTATGRKLPSLRNVFRKPGGSRTTGHFQATDNFPTWRNDVFGHGVFKQDLGWYAAQAAEWAKKLVALYEGLKPVFDGWMLIGRTADGQTVDWSGCEFEPKRDLHQHDPLGHALPLFLGNGGTELSFGPLLSVQRCKGCDHPAAFFFDRQKTADETVLLEYFAGTKGKKNGWAEVDVLKQWLPTAFKWERRLYDTGELLDGVPILFRDFDREYLRPAYLLDAIGRRLDATQKGYVLLDGPEGTGKSYLARGLAEKETDLGLKVLAYYVRPGDLSHFASFLIELNRQVHDKLLPANKRTFEPQAKGATTAAELQAEFVEYFTTVLAGRPGAVLVIDGLDELPDADPTTPLMTDLLPDAAKLPNNLHIVLTARGGELKPRAAARWHALSAGALRLTLDPTSPDNRALVGAYLEQQNTTAVADILDRSGGVFLYAWHFVAALRQGVFAGTADLPPAEQFYPAFLDRIRRRVGDTLFDTVYLKLLMLLTAARVPVTREQIERWGLPADRLATALNDLRDFVRQLRHRDWHEGMGDDAEPRYKIAHEAFVRYAEAHEAERLTAAHRTIATVALRHTETKWEGLDPADDGDLYDVRFVLWHCDAAGMTTEADGLRRDDKLALGMWETAVRLDEAARHRLAVEVFKRCLFHYRNTAAQGGLKSSADLTAVLLNTGGALGSLGQFREAVEHFDQVISISRRFGTGQKEMAGRKAGALVNKGKVLYNLGELTESLACVDEAISALRPLAENGPPDATDNLAAALVNRGNCLNALGEFRAAVESYQDAVEIRRRRLVEGQPDTLAALSNALAHKGVGLTSLGELRESVKCDDEAIAILRRLVELGRVESMKSLANTLGSKGVTLYALGELRAATDCHTEAVSIFRQVVSGGRDELVPDLALALINQGNPLADQGDPQSALACYEESLVLLDTLVTGGRSEFTNRLAMALVNTGCIHQRLGEPIVAVQRLDAGLGLFVSLLQSGQLHFLPQVLHAARLTFDLLTSQNEWQTAVGILGGCIVAFRAKQRDSGITPPDQKQMNYLLGAAARLSTDGRARLLAEANDELANILRSQVFTTPPPQ